MVDKNFRIPNFDMEGLKTFFMVAKTKSFSAAAEQLHKTPAAISYRIRALEDQIGMPLFKRSTRTVELLPAGEHLIECTTQIYELLLAIPLELQQINLGVEPEFTIVVNNILYSDEAVSTLISALYQRFPYTRFSIERAVYMGVWDQLIYSQAHFAIGVPTWHPINESYETRPIGEVKWSFVFAPSHPLAHTSEDEVLSDEQLRHYFAINVADTAVKLSKRVAWLLSGQREIVVPTLRTKLQCHVNGVGVGFLPENMVKPYLLRRELLTRKLVNGRTSSPMAISWKKGAQGLITEFLKELFLKQDPLIEPFLRMIDLKSRTNNSNP